MHKYIRFNLISRIPTSYVSITILFFFIVYINLINFFPSNTFANTDSSSYSSLENHRLKNFILSAKGKDNWTRMMLAIMNSVPAVEKILEEEIPVNIRGTEKFAGVTPLIFASSLGKLSIVKLLTKKKCQT